jgi:poly(3-hydroxybutyrate) depolymerase
MQPLLYTFYEWQADGLFPAHFFAENVKNMSVPFAGKNPFIDWLYAASSLISRSTMSFDKPDFNIKTIVVDDNEIRIEEEIAASKTFCKLRYFKRILNGKNYQEDAPCFLVVAPMSGHFATLVRDTIQTLLQDFNVYVTDWEDVKHIPLEEGDFNLNTYIAYLLDDIKSLKEKHVLHVLAVCQPAVPVMLATALLSDYASDLQPDSMILMGGPIDTRINPGKVNLFSMEHDENWVKRYMVSRVPAKFKGHGRLVLPGFTMLSGFMALNPDKHQESLQKFYQHLVQGDMESAEKHEVFYNEYRSVMDLSASYFLDSYKTVFRDFSLPKNEYYFGDYHANLQSIQKTALLTIEGELDDISPVGQTKAAHDLCINIPSAKKIHHFQKNVGHYGIFNGKRWRNEIYPVIKDFVKSL